MKFLSVVFVFFVFQSLSGQNPALKSFESKTDIFLTAYVVDGFVNYKLIAKSALSELVMQIEEINLSELNEIEKQSFYINAYNVLVIDQVFKNYPTVSIKDIPGFFDSTKYKSGNEKLTLDGIEKDILLKRYKDSRFHSALICGAKDCPKIWNRAFTSANLNAELDARTRQALNDSSFFKETEKGRNI